MSYEYADVGLYKDKIWIKGTLAILMGNGSCTLTFTPSMAGQENFMVTCPVNAMQEIAGGQNKDGEQFLRISMMIPGKKKSKCLFSLGNRVHAKDTITSLLQSAHHTTAAASSSSSSSNATRSISPATMNAATMINGGSGPNSSSSSSSNSNAPGVRTATPNNMGGGNYVNYFEKYKNSALTTSSSSNRDNTLEIPDDPNLSEAENKARRELIKSDPELRDLYRAVVLDGIMSADDFWAMRLQQIDEEVALLSQSRGLSTGLTADLHPTSTNQDGILYELTVEQIKRIFLEQPAVYTIYKDKVPRELTEIQFWTLYLQSKYFHQNSELSAEDKASEKIREASAVFGDFDEGKDDDDTKKKSVALDFKGSRPNGVHVDPNVDLLQTLQDNPHGSENELSGVGMGHRTGYGLVHRDPAEEKKDDEIRERLRKLGRRATLDDLKRLQNKPLESSALLSRYNRHAVFVLPDEEHNPSRLGKRIRRMIESEKDAEVFHDLEEAGGIKRLPDPVSLDLQDVSGYMAVGGTQNRQASMEMDQSNENEMTEEFLSLFKPERCRLENWNPHKIAKIMPDSSTAVQVLDHIIGNKSQQDPGERNVTDVEQIPDHEELLALHNAATETKRLFWSQFPPKIRGNFPMEEQSSIKKLKATVEKLMALELRTRDFREYAKNNGNRQLAMLLLDIIEQIKKATNDWEKFYSREINKRRA